MLVYNGVCVKVGTGLGVSSCWCLVSSVSGHQPPSLSCYLWARACLHQPSASPEPQHFHITALLQCPAPQPHTTSVISTSGPTSLRLLTRTTEPHGQGDGGVQVIVSVCKCSSLWHFLNLEKRFESEPSSQEEVKSFMVEEKNFMAPIMIIYCLILISNAAMVFWKNILVCSVTKFNQGETCCIHCLTDFWFQIKNASDFNCSRKCQCSCIVVVNLPGKTKPATWKWEQMECIEKFRAAEQCWCQSSGDIMRLWQSKLKLCFGLGIRQWMQRCGTDFSIGYRPNCSPQVTYLFSKPQPELGLVHWGTIL